jgi:hypothetical protein
MWILGLMPKYYIYWWNSADPWLIHRLADYFWYYIDGASNPPNIPTKWVGCIDIDSL